MWEGGPLRNWSDCKTTLTPMSHNLGGLVGAYVCERCLGSCDGVYLAKKGQKAGRCGSGPRGEQIEPGRS